MANKEFRISEIQDGLVVSGVRLDQTVVTKAAGFVASQAAGEAGMGRYTGARPTPTHHEVAQLAYRLYECHGRQDGNDIEDWVHAEQILSRHYA
jgi:hypothetical protein